MVALKNSGEEATNIDALDVVHLCQEDRVIVPVGKGDLHLLPVRHPLKLDVTLLSVTAGGSPGPP